MSINETGNDLSDQSVIETATVLVSAPVPNRVPRKRRKRAPKSPPLPVNDLVVDPRVMEAAKALLRPGVRLQIVDSECVRVVNK